ncbi:MAG: efflux transporter outer membrane subunit [bacterium]|jgi:NodT family efflux transporter outer membrane factor (OMF) lipoprotein
MTRPDRAAPPGAALTRTTTAWVRPCLAAPALALLLGGCIAVGPDYRRPEAPVSADWKQAGLWKPATPQDLSRNDAWWTVFGDPRLDTLIAAIEPSNQNIRAAEAQYRQALALITQARAGLFPTLTANAQATRSQSPATTNPRTGITTAGGNATVQDGGVSVSWEVDLWGRIARTLEAGEASAQASAADLAAARLSARAALAQAYFQLRVAERRAQLLAETVEANRRALLIAENRYAAGVVPRSDVIQARSQLASVEAQLIDIQVPQAQLQHAIALLIGRPPAALTIAPGTLPPLPSPLPLVLPSALLERRPDIAAAERRVAAANAQIGVAAAAWFPSLTLSGAAGFRSTDLSTWITAPARYWSLGPSLALPLFDAGRRRGVVEQNVAVYDQRVAQYRQTVLAALVEVEDNLVALRVLSDEAAVQARAVDLARQTLQITLNQYKAGLVGFSSLVIAQTSLLSAEQAALSVLGRQFDASVVLVRALGGGWSGGESEPATGGR